jgi:hypothetical protein
VFVNIRFYKEGDLYIFWEGKSPLFFIKVVSIKKVTNVKVLDVNKT